MVHRLMFFAALLALAFVAVPASAQQERTAQDEQRATPSDKAGNYPNASTADTSSLGREATGIPTGDVDPSKAQFPDTSRTLTTRQGDEAQRGEPQPAEPGAATVGPETQPGEVSNQPGQVSDQPGQVSDQPYETPDQPAPEESKPTPAGDVSAARAAGEPGMTANLVDAGKKAREKEATVEVQVSGIQIIDPAQTDGQPKAGQGHLHYRMDGGPVIATTADKLSFHELRPGRHQLLVQLAGNDHKPLGPQQTFTINVP